VKKDRKEVLTFTKAVELLHRTGTRMMIMHASDGDHFYIVPGGGGRAKRRREDTAARRHSGIRRRPFPWQSSVMEDG